MLDLTELQQRVQVWRKRNFPKADATQQLLGIGEEVGELMHAHLKEIQGIRGTERQHQEDAMDAIGDLFIYMIGYCSCLGWKIEGILEATVARVLARDWIADPVAGGETKPASGTTVFITGPPCVQCGALMIRTGTCHTCPSCGFNDGCG